MAMGKVENADKGGISSFFAAIICLTIDGENYTVVLGRKV